MAKYAMSCLLRLGLKSKGWKVGTDRRDRHSTYSTNLCLFQETSIGSWTLWTMEQSAWWGWRSPGWVARPRRFFSLSRLSRLISSQWAGRTDCGEWGGRQRCSAPFGSSSRTLLSRWSSTGSLSNCSKAIYKVTSILALMFKSAMCLKHVLQ